MYDDDYKIHISNDGLPTDFSLEDILAEYRAQVPEQPEPDESLSMRSKRIVMEAIDQTISAASVSSMDELVDEAVEECLPEEEPEPPETEETEAEDALPEEEAELTEREEAVIAELAAEKREEEALPEPEVQALVDADERDSYAAGGAEETEVPVPEEPEERRKALKERFMSPLLALMALIAMRRGQREKGENRAPTEEREDENVPEMSPDKAAKLYTSQLRSLNLRAKLASILTLVMMYLSFAHYSSLPLLGSLRDSVKMVSLVMLIFELTVMLTGLDVITAGLMSLVRKKPNYDSLAAASCILSVLDAIVLGLGGISDYGLPFCAVSALSLTCALWGGFLTCKGYRSGFRMLSMSKKLYSVTGERNISGSGIALLKSTRGIKGFVTRSEEADMTEYVYSILTPVLIILSVVLGLIAAAVRSDMKSAVHCASALLAASAAFSGAISFALPFSITARRLFQSGAAIAGWSGARDIGKSRQVVITDNDVFPQGTVEINSIRILEGAFTDKVISYTGSVIIASGSGLSHPFAELIRRNGYSINRVEGFRPHDGGGMTAVVNGETVAVGNSGFMNLMGVRVPGKLNTKSSVYSAINGALVGIFAIEYKPVASVQSALIMLLHSNREPIFAIRDFNITPLMIQKKFQMPTDIFEFPSYSERFRISGTEPEENSKLSAVITREGMGPLVDAADRGRRMFSAVRFGTVLSAVGSVLGLILMFLLCWAGAFSSATASNVLLFMLLWLLPAVVVSWGLQR